jgi:hypothetical protein
MSSPSAADVAELAVPLLGLREEDEADHDEVTAAEDADAAGQPGDLEQGLNSAPQSEAGGSKAEDEAAYEVGLRLDMTLQLLLQLHYIQECLPMHTHPRSCCWQ